MLHLILLLLRKNKDMSSSVSCVGRFVCVWGGYRIETPGCIWLTLPSGVGWNRIPTLSKKQGPGKKLDFTRHFKNIKPPSFVSKLYYDVN